MTKKKLAELQQQCAFLPRYSGKQSAEFWSTIITANDAAIYTLGCVLQETEGRVLREVNAALMLQVRAIVQKTPVEKRGRSPRGDSRRRSTRVRKSSSFSTDSRLPPEEGTR